MIFEDKRKINNFMFSDKKKNLCLLILTWNLIKIKVYVMI